MYAREPPNIDANRIRATTTTLLVFIQSLAKHKFPAKAKEKRTGLFSGPKFMLVVLIMFFSFNSTFHFHQLILLNYWNKKTF